MATQSAKTNGRTSQTTRQTPARQPEQRSTSDMQPMNDVIDYAKQYSRKKPEVAALWCFGIGFILGWKIKPW